MSVRVRSCIHYMHVSYTIAWMCWFIFKTLALPEGFPDCLETHWETPLEVEGCCNSLVAANACLAIQHISCGGHVHLFTVEYKVKWLGMPRQIPEDIFEGSPGTDARKGYLERRNTFSRFAADWLPQADVWQGRVFVYALHVIHDSIYASENGCALQYTKNPDRPPETFLAMKVELQTC